MLITIPKILREKLGDEAAEGLIELLNNFSENTHNSVITLAVEKFERRLAEEIGKFRSEVTEQNASLRSELHEEIAALRNEVIQQNATLRSEVAEQNSKLRSELFEKTERGQTTTIRWMFLFWVGQIGVLLGFLFAFFK
ncbi:MAG TPA: hypothetical protein VJ967_08800 [Clostridia bacterium]|nr:hypothetical protein [Clostridia bacterium]